ncbi:MAG: hypothetical protein ABEK01_01365 [Candidatus Nanohaloarchaea archaeon]
MENKNIVRNGDSGSGRETMNVKLDQGPEAGTRQDLEEDETSREDPTYHDEKYGKANQDDSFDYDFEGEARKQRILNGPKADAEYDRKTGEAKRVEEPSDREKLMDQVRANYSNGTGGEEEPSPREAMDRFLDRIGS